MLFWVAVHLLISSTVALDNGLARTPPMGWLSWLSFGCTIDCEAKPYDCISENLIKRTADAVARDYLEAGYQYVTVDDCWLEKQRGPDGRLVPDRRRFPSGMKALADYVHSKGLKFGIYQDCGTATCENYPGIKGHEQLDATTLAEWGIDYLKVDGCNADVREMDAVYPTFGRLLNQTGRPILYACSWPFFQETNGIQSNYTAIAKDCNIWRNYYDIQNSWFSVLRTMDWLGDNQHRLAPYAGPGHFNDPDMLVVGNSGLTVDQARVQMAIWSILAAPLMMSLDLATIKPEFKAILLNKDVIAVNQDQLGKQGLRIWKDKISGERSYIEIWNRDLSDDSRAVAFVNRGPEANTTFTLDEIQLPRQSYLVQNLYQDEEARSIEPHEDFRVQINATGVRFYKFIPKKPESV